MEQLLIDVIKRRLWRTYGSCVDITEWSKDETGSVKFQAHVLGVMPSDVKGLVIASTGYIGIYQVGDHLLHQMVEI